MEIEELREFSNNEKMKIVTCFKFLEYILLDNKVAPNICFFKDFNNKYRRSFKWFK